LLGITPVFALFWCVRPDGGEGQTLVLALMLVEVAAGMIFYLNRFPNKGIKA